jgi:lipoprotein-releasing system permease protein
MAHRLAHLRSGHRNRFISFIALISILGLALGVAALIVVLSVMNGFEYELRQRILSMTSHATLMGLRGRLDDWPRVRAQALADPAVERAVPYIEDQGMLVNGERVSGAQIRGIVPADERSVSSLADHMTSGRLEELEPGGYRIVLGSVLARELALKVGDTVVLVVARGNVTPVGVVPRMRRFTVSGIFNAGMYEYDRGLALVALADAARLYRLGEGVTGVRLRLDDLYQAPAVVHNVAVALGGGYFVSDWTRRHANLFRSIELTKSIMFFILVLVVAVAAVNIVSTLVMIVKEKQSDIAILRTMGSTPGSVLAVFIVQGAVIGLLGTLAGIGLGMLISGNLESLVHALERALNTTFMDSVYLMSDLPARVEMRDVIQIAGPPSRFAACRPLIRHGARRARSLPRHRHE